MRALAIALVVLAACSSKAPPPKKTTPSSSGGAQYGMATWYGKEQHGGPTASGERFDRFKLTAAHKTLRMGTRVKVTNQKNGKSVVVRINDRGPYAKGRIIDLSEAAAKVIDMIDAGVVPVRIDVVH